MQCAFRFPAAVERSGAKERLEASLAGLCELELRRQRQECLVLGALALGAPLTPDGSRGGLGCFSNWSQENLTLRRQLVRRLALHALSQTFILPTLLPLSSPVTLWFYLENYYFLFACSQSLLWCVCDRSMDSCFWAESFAVQMTSSCKKVSQLD